IQKESWGHSKWFNEARGVPANQGSETPVSRKEGKDMARKIGADKYYEISAYTGKYVTDMVLSIEKRLKP
ncbi:hypothetical protein AVEN_193309-1, partial [Araneus ventricosus]